jgi:hypothetical protein
VSGFGAGVTAGGTSGSKPGNRLSAHHGCRSGLGFFCWLLAERGRFSVFCMASRGRESAGVCVGAGVCADLWGIVGVDGGHEGRVMSGVAGGAVTGGFWPPHPRPLSPVSRGRGGELVFSFLYGEPRTGVRGCGCGYLC